MDFNARLELPADFFDFSEIVQQIAEFFSSVLNIKIERIEKFHVSLSRPSDVPLAIERPLLGKLKNLFDKKFLAQSSGIYLKPQIDVMLTPDGIFCFAVPIDLDVSFWVADLIDDVDGVIREFGLNEYHKKKSPHITFAYIKPLSLEIGNLLYKMISRIATMNGPAGSQFFPAVFKLKDEISENEIPVQGILVKCGSLTDRFSM